MALPVSTASAPAACAVHSPSCRARVDRERAAPVVVGLVDAQLHLDGAVGRNDQRRMQGQFLDRRALDERARGQRELEQGGAGQQHGAVDGVVGEPRVGLEREAAGEQPFVLARDRARWR